MQQLLDIRLGHFSLLEGYQFLFLHIMTLDKNHTTKNKLVPKFNRGIRVARQGKAQSAHQAHAISPQAIRSLWVDLFTKQQLPSNNNLGLIFTVKKIQIKLLPGLWYYLTAKVYETNN